MAEPISIDQQEQTVRIARMIEETLKFTAEQHKLAAEQQKLAAEQRNSIRDASLSGWQLVIAGMAAGGALIGATVAALKFMGG